MLPAREPDPDLPPGAHHGAVPPEHGHAQCAPSARAPRARHPAAVPGGRPVPGSAAAGDATVAAGQPAAARRAAVPRARIRGLPPARRARHVVRLLLDAVVREPGGVQRGGRRASDVHGCADGQRQGGEADGETAAHPGTADQGKYTPTDDNNNNNSQRQTTTAITDNNSKRRQQKIATTINNNRQQQQATTANDDNRQQ